MNFTVAPALDRLGRAAHRAGAATLDYGTYLRAADARRWACDMKGSWALSAV
ncbi:MAG: hypothetical protein ACRDSR_03445 [Pseudonocardiaceae bacterium]